MKQLTASWLCKSPGQRTFRLSSRVYKQGRVPLLPQGRISRVVFPCNVLAFLVVPPQPSSIVTTLSAGHCSTYMDLDRSRSPPLPHSHTRMFRSAGCSKMFQVSDSLFPNVGKVFRASAWPHTLLSFLSSNVFVPDRDSSFNPEYGCVPSLTVVIYPPLLNALKEPKSLFQRRVVGFCSPPSIKRTTTGRHAQKWQVSSECH